jgi:hypothetical protein
MPVIPGTYDRRTHSGQVVLEGVAVTVWSRRQADRLAATHGEVIDWSSSPWPHDVTPDPAGMDAFARLAEAGSEFIAAVRACRALGDDLLDQDSVTRLIERIGQGLGDY